MVVTSSIVLPIAAVGNTQMRQGSKNVVLLVRTSCTSCPRSDADFEAHGSLDGHFYRVLWLADFGRGLFLEHLQDFVDSALELGVGAFGHYARVVDDFDVGVDSVAFDEPFAFGAVESHRRYGDGAAI